jgi:thiosulfate dehydrogenase
MRIFENISVVAVVVVTTAGVAVAQSPRSQHALPAAKSGDLVVGLCDGVTSVEVHGVKPGETMTRAQAQAVSNDLMREWKRKAARGRWDDEERLAQNGPTPNATSPPPAAAGVPAFQKPARQDGQIYGAYTDRDEAIWRASTQAFVDRGNHIFHDATELGGTIGVSCDMCHPNAANTHAETYPKFQVQLGRVAMLRDMINWCVENPVRGKPLADDDPKMKALEAYVTAQRKGVALDYGRH